MIKNGARIILIEEWEDDAKTIPCKHTGELIINKNDGIDRINYRSMIGL